VTVLDAYAVIAYLRNEAAAGQVASLLRGSTLMTSTSLSEVIDQLVRVYQQDSDDVDAGLALLSFGGMSVEPVTEDHAVLAGLLRARHYSFRQLPVTLADCTAASVALITDLPLATSDPHLLELMAAEGGDTYPLPDSKGHLA